MTKTKVDTLLLVITGVECFVQRLDTAYRKAVSNDQKTVEIPIDDVRKAISIALAYKERIGNIEVDTYGVRENDAIRMISKKELLGMSKWNEDQRKQWNRIFKGNVRMPEDPAEVVRKVLEQDSLLGEVSTALGEKQKKILDLEAQVKSLSDIMAENENRIFSLTKENLKLQRQKHAL